MAATNFTPISLYYSTTAAAVPTSGNLANGELGINIQDEKLYFKNAAGTVKLLASNATSAPVLSFQTSLSGLTPSTATTGAVTLAGTLGVASGGTGLTAGTSGGVLAYTAAGTLASSTALAASALVIGGGAGAAPSTTTTGTGVVTALGVNTGTAGAFVVNGGALGSPASVGTMPAFTLGGTVSGGGNQINNVVIGTTTPLAGAFTSLTASTTLGVTGVSTLTGGAVVQGMTVGLGGGASALNTVLGYQAKTGIYGGQLTAIGYQALNGTLASYNTAVGYQSSYSNYNGYYNTSVGYASLLTNSDGQYNVAIGSQSLQFSTTASFNTAVGHQSLNANTTASNNTAVGYQALYTSTTYGLNTAVGYRALATVNTDGYNTAVGANCLESTSTGGFNAGFGRITLNANTTGSYNTGLGYGALQANTTASNNTAVGYQAAYANTTGQHTVVGKGSLYATTISTGNAILGYDCITSGSATTNVQYNTAIGNTSLQALQNGATYNTAVGFGSGSAITTGAKNSILGAYTGSAAPISATGSNFVVLSDGDGNIVASAKTAQTFALQGAVPNSGTGITFPATQSASSDANTLDDYEEGTWTPTLASTGGGTIASGTYSRRVGNYVKVGKLVTVQWQVQVTSATALSAGSIQITGFPFTCENTSINRWRTFVLFWFQTGVSCVTVQAQISPNTSVVDLYPLTTSGVDNAASNVTLTTLGTGYVELAGNFSYTTT